MARLFSEPYQKGRRNGSYLAGRIIDAVDRDMEPAEAFMRIWTWRKSPRGQSWRLGEFDGARRRLEINGQKALRTHGANEAAKLATIILMIENGGEDPSGHDMMQLISDWEPKSRRRNLTAAR